ncbi:hypothetical protein H0W26_01320, partial [Candidatus Dependentiae bacterium]|nr:hypothetical protein [Candidatus Dependentiae bacterium]
MKNNRMKNVLFLTLIGLVSMKAHAMEKNKPLSVSEAEVDYQDQLASSPLYTPELKLRVMKFLFHRASAPEPFKDFKACSLVDKQSLTFFKNSKQFTQEFLKFLYNSCYYYDLDLSTIDTIYPLLNSKGVAKIENNIFAFNYLIPLFTHSTTPTPFSKEPKETRNNDGSMRRTWDNVLRSLHNFNLCSLSNHAMDFYWDGEYLSSSFPSSRVTSRAKWTFLTYALDRGAPDTIIKFLITCSPSLNQLHPMTPSPFLIIFQKYIGYYSDYKRLCSEEEVDSIRIERQVIPNLNFLKERMAMLIQAGTSIEIPYKAADRVKTPLLCALDSYTEILSYLLEKNPRLNSSLECEKIADLLSQGAFSDSLMAYLTTRSNNELQPLLRILIKLGKEKLPSMVEISLGLLLDRAKALIINDLHEGMTLLDVAVTTNAQDKVIAMLCKNGAQGNSITQFTMNYRKELKICKGIPQADLLMVL